VLYKYFLDDTNDYVEIFKNPTTSELRDVCKRTRYYFLRGMLKPNGDVYVWVGYYLHYLMSEYTGKGGMKFTYSPKNKEGDKWKIELVDGTLQYKEIIEYINKYIKQLKTIGDTQELEEYLYA